MAAYRYRGGPTGRVRQLVHQRASQRFLLNQPDLSRHVTDQEPEPLPKPPTLTDWPVIHTNHPYWWQVHRVVMGKDGSRGYQLIAECRSEDEAFRVASQQLHQCRITKWGDKRPPYFSAKSPKVCESE